MSEFGESNAMGGSPFTSLNRPPNEATDVKNPPESAQNTLLEEIDSDRKSGERGTNWKGTLSKIFKNKSPESNANNSEENLYRKTSSLGKMFKRGEKKDEKHEMEKTKSRSKTFSKFLKKWPFRSEPNTPAETTPKNSSPLTATVDF